MLHIAICDDEKVICKQIEEFISDFQKKNSVVFKVDIFYNGEDIYERIAEGQFYDLIFMDIELYHLNGIEVGKYIRKEQDNEITQIAFVSSKQSYAMDLFSVRPLDFILKPISYERIAFCLDFVLKRKKQHRTVFSYQVSGITKTVPPEDILYILSSARKVILKTMGSSDEFYGKLDDLEKKLKDLPFIRIHKSALINYLWIESVKNLDVTMKDGTVLQISHPKKKTVYENLNMIKMEGIFRWK